MKLHQLIFTKNLCYIAGRKIVPRGILVHSTGCNAPGLKRWVGPDDGVVGKNLYNNHWNSPGKIVNGKLVEFRKCCHAFIGKMADGTVATYQVLPWDHRGWHCAGSGNDTHISFEMCEDGLTNREYLNKVWSEATELCAMLCKMYDLPINSIVGHYEAHKMGIANNHGDPQNWFKRHGLTMDMFRADVARLLEGNVPKPEPKPNPDLVTPEEDPIVKIKIMRDENSFNLKKPIGTIIEIPIEEYLLGVVPAEMGNPPVEAAQAQAIIARTYAFNLLGTVLNDGSPHQAWRYARSIDKAYLNAHEGVKSTRGLVLAYKGAVIDGAWYSDSNGGTCLRSGEVWSSDRPYLLHRADPWTLATEKPKNGHGIGMSQVGAAYAAVNGVSHQNILSFYYPGTEINDNYGKEKSMGKYAKINTAGAGGLSLWSTTDRNTRKRLITVAKGEIIEILSDNNSGWVWAEYDGIKGYADKQYLAEVPPVIPPSKPSLPVVDVDAYAVELAHIAQRLNVISQALVELAR